MNYEEFLETKSHLGTYDGFDPLWMPDFLYDFQKALVEWAVRKGRCAIFADCGLGKTPMQLVWAQNVVEKTNGNVLIITPLAVSYQTINEGRKFGIEINKSNDGTPKSKLTITNYEKLHLFNSNDFVGCVCDESSAIKSFHGVRREIVTTFMRKHKYRLLATATAAPNDYIELGTSSEALGNLDRLDMMSRFFKNDERTSIVAHEKWTGQNGGSMIGWRLKGHAEIPFWKWVSSWARALRMPSDLGYDNNEFILPDISENYHIVEAKEKAQGMLFELDAVGLSEEREEQRRTINERCEKTLELLNGIQSSIVWCNLNDEGRLLKKIIPDSVEISGSDKDDKKEEAFISFSKGEIKTLITKPKIGAFGMNWQHCNHEIYFPTHSYEQYYQAVRRCWRFGQKKPVVIDIVSTKGGANIMSNLQWKSKKADEMFKNLVLHMNDATKLNRKTYNETERSIPKWAMNG